MKHAPLLNEKEKREAREKRVCFGRESVRGYSSGVERSLCMREVWGSNPHTSKTFCHFLQTLDFMWQAPAALRGGQNAANQIAMDATTDDRVKFTLKGAAPFKNNYVVYYDFRAVSSSRF